jgi:hypothetical protein
LGADDGLELGLVPGDELGAEDGLVLGLSLGAEDGLVLGAGLGTEDGLILSCECKGNRKLSQSSGCLGLKFTYQTSLQDGVCGELRESVQRSHVLITVRVSAFSKGFSSWRNIARTQVVVEIHNTGVTLANLKGGTRIFHHGG